MATQSVLTIDRSAPHHNKMSAAVITAPGQLEIQHVDRPEPGPGEVRVRLQGCGVCASNLPPWEGRPWFNYPMAPGSLGHEAWGEIDAVGADVTTLRVGDRVATLSTQAYAEYAVCAADDAIALPTSLGDVPFPGEPLACAMNVFERADIRPGQRVAVIGIGFLGALLTRLAVSSGASVVAISRRPYALELARMLGADEQIPMRSRQEVVDQIRSRSNDARFERVIEAVGNQEALDLAGELIAERGRLVIAGYHQDGMRQVNMQLWNWRGIDVINAHERDPKRYRDGVRKAIDAVQAGLLDPKPLYTHRFGLAELDKAFEMVRTRPSGFLKALIVL